MLLAAPRRAIAAERSAKKISPQRVKQRRHSRRKFFTGPRSDREWLDLASIRQAKGRWCEHATGSRDPRVDGGILQPPARLTELEFQERVPTSQHTRARFPKQATTQNRSHLFVITRCAKR